jgi:hypothetical protein
MLQAARKTTAPSASSMCSQSRMPSSAPVSKLRQQHSAMIPSLAAQLLAFQFEDIERIQERLAGTTTTEHDAHAIGLGDAIRAADHHLAVERHRGDRELAHGLGDRRQLRAPVVTAA